MCLDNKRPMPQSAQAPGDWEGALGGTRAKAIRSLRLEAPPMKEVLGAIPPECFVKDTRTSLAYCAFSTALTLAIGALAYALLPTDRAPLWSAPAWLLYAAVEGTVATGCWVIAHECGHGSFCDNKILQDAVGYLLHTCLLVPYYSWQRSHAVHHSRTNHLSEGETHCPPKAGEEPPLSGASLSGDAFAVANLATHLLFGWPAYLLVGATGGPSRGVSNHFVPFNSELFPGRWRAKVLLSDAGLLAFAALLWAWARLEGSWTPVLLVYGLPYLVVNGWLVLYTWLQHTDVDIPHLDGEHWSWVRGAFLTVDRPYGALLDLLHHRIGSTHVAHHVCSRIPHYHALKATRALSSSFPEFYLYDPTPLPAALWRVARNCLCVEEHTQQRRGRRGERGAAKAGDAAGDGTVRYWAFVSRS